MKTILQENPSLFNRLPIMPRDVSLSDSKCWNGRYEWVNSANTTNREGWRFSLSETLYQKNTGQTIKKKELNKHIQCVIDCTDVLTIMIKSASRCKATIRYATFRVSFCRNRRGKDRWGNIGGEKTGGEKTGGGKTGGEKTGGEKT